MNKERKNDLKSSPELKIVLLATLSLFAVLLDNLPTLFLLYVFTLLVMLASKPRLSNILFLGLLSIAAVWGFVITQSFFYSGTPRTILITLFDIDAPVIGQLTGGIHIYLEGAVHGAFQSVRFLIMLTGGMTVVWNLSPREFLIGFQRLFLPRPVAFILTASLRFIPSIAHDFQIVLKSMKIRGMDLHWTKPWNYFAAVRYGLMPMIHRNIRRATMLADSVESRGFGIKNMNKGSKYRRYNPGEKILIISISIVVVSLLLAKSLLWLTLTNSFTINGIEAIYEFIYLYL